MPEGPEVRIVAEELNLILKGLIVTHITVVDGPFRFNPKPIYDNYRQGVKELNRYTSEGRIRVDFVRNKGKYLYLHLVSEETANGTPKFERFMLSHLAMGGNWLTVTGAHTMVVLRYLDRTGKEQKLYYHDHRHQGKLYMFDREQTRQWLARIGPDVLSRGFTREVYSTIMSNARVRNMTLDVMIMEQRYFSGIGNYLRAEILYAARLDPRRRVGDLNNAELGRLYSAIVVKTKKSYAAGGTTLATYKDVYGREGGYKPVIYDSVRDPRGNPVVKYSDANDRTMYWVPAVQQ